MLTNTAAAHAPTRRTLTAKFPGTCAVTGTRFQAGAEIVRAGRGYALASAVAEPVDEVAPVTVPADSTLVVVSCEVDDLDAATFFDYLGTGAGPQRRANAMQAYARMPVVARAQVVAGLRERLDAGVTDLQVRAWMVAFIATHEAAIVVWSPDHGVSFHIEATIGLAGDKVTVHASENYVLRGAAAKEFASKALAAVSAALADAGIDGRTQVTRRGGKKFTWQPTGYWHMGQFCCNGRSASIRIAGVKA